MDRKVISMNIMCDPAPLSLNKEIKTAACLFCKDLLVVEWLRGFRPLLGFTNTSKDVKQINMRIICT